MSGSILNNREESQDYAGVVLSLGTDWRVIVCRDGIQWILQRRAGLRHGRARWEARAYCATREGLKLRCREFAGASVADLVAVLPSTIKGGHAHG